MEEEYYVDSDLLSKYSLHLSYLSIPVDKIHDYKWVYDNIDRLNPYEDRLKYVISLKTALRKILNIPEEPDPIVEYTDDDIECNGIDDLINDIRLA